MKRPKFIIIVMALSVSFNAFSFEATISKHNICSFNQLEYRSIRIQNIKPKYCDAVYTKVGKDQRIGGGEYTSTCDRIFKNVIANLSGAGWVCKNAFGSQVTVGPTEGKVWRN